MSDVLTHIELSGVLAELPEEPSEELPWAHASRSGNMAEALSLVEQRLTMQKDDAETKLWWVFLHLKQKGMPLSALSAPLEELFQALRADAKLRGFGCKVYLLLATGLVERAQFRLAVLMLERAEEFVHALEVSEESVWQVQDALLAVLRAEHKGAEVRREPRSYLDSVALKVEGLEKKIKKRTPKKKRKEVPQEKIAEEKKKSPVISSKTILVSALSPSASPSAEFDDKKSNNTKKSESVQGRAQSSTQSTAQWDESERSDGGKLPEAPCPISQSRIGAMFLAVGILAVLFCGYWYFYLNVQGGGLLNRTRFPMLVSEQPTTLLSELPRRDGSEVVLGSGFSEIHERLKTMDIRGGNDRNSVPSDGNEQQGPSSSPVSELRPPEVGAVDHPGHTPEPSLPEYDPKNIANAEVQSVGQVPGRSDLTGLQADKEGRVFGPARTLENSPLHEAKRGLAGERVESVEVEQFTPPKHFKTLTATEVLSAPSLLAVSYAKIESGATVQVVARLGRWLELRSTGGRRGYIYAQNAEEVRQ